MPSHCTAESATQLSVSPSFLARSKGTSLASSSVESSDVPEICRFNGIFVTMLFEEHGRPHFHARFGEFRISVEIEGSIVQGRIP